MSGALEVELKDEACVPGLRLSAKHGFVEAAGLKTIGLDLGKHALDGSRIQNDIVVSLSLEVNLARFLMPDCGRISTPSNSKSYRLG
jgi:hypothetical protein